ncbi:hypothetical protein ROHU_016307 [Labeo rohita]|uniref:Uncharacterized protein n=1 Tax=Labeo rohita TaxID=84645 RepID=A0A498NKC9_LABRO|nr:hypothetical protein ROHU_016307 [Labeo rohita]
MLGDQDSRHCTRRGGRDVEFCPLGEEGERQTRLGGLSRQLMGDQDSGRCTRQGGRDEEFGPPGGEGERQTRLGGLSRHLMGDQDSKRCTRRGGEGRGEITLHGLSANQGLVGFFYVGLVSSGLALEGFR